LAARLRRAAARRPSQEELGAWGFLLLLSGGRAVPALERALAAGPPDALVLNDLGAAYLGLASPGEPLDYLRALDAFDRALALHPDLAAARFNRALALQRLTLRRHARLAWNRYLQLDRSSGWASEARRQLQALDEPTDTELWEQGLPALTAAALAGREGAVARAVSRFPQLARLHAEERLLPAWAAAAAHGRAEEAERSLAVARAIGKALGGAGGDAMVRDAVAAVDRSRNLDATSLGLASAAYPSTDGMRAAGGGTGERLRLDGTARLAAGHAAYGAGIEREQVKDYRRAAQDFETARAALALSGSPFAAAASFQLARCAYLRAAYPEVSRLLRDILAYAAASHHFALAGGADWLTGTTLILQGRPSESLAHYRSALARFERIAESGNTSILHSLIASNLGFLGEAGGAWTHRYQALLGLARLDDPWLASGIVGEAAGATLDIGEARVGLYFQDELVDLMRAAGEPADIATALRQRASIDHRLGLTAKALQDLGEARTFIGRIADRDVRAIDTGEALLAEGVIRSAGDSAGALAALDRALVLIGTNYRVLAPEIFLARARVLRRMKADERVFRSLAAGIEECERQRTAVDLGHRVSWFAQSQDLYSEMVGFQIERRNDPVAAFTYVEKGRARALLDMIDRLPPGAAPAPLRAFPQDLLDASQLRRRLPAGAVVIEYQLAGRELLIWVVSRDASAFRRVPVDEQALRNAPLRLAGAARSGAGGEFAATASFGYRTLIAPIRYLISGAALLVLVPDPAFAAMPFAALRDPATGRYLIEDWPVVAAPSAHVFVRCRRRAEALRHRADHAVLALGSPRIRADLFPALSPLPSAIAEAQAVASTYKGTRLLLDQAATKSAFLSAAPHAWIVHFAGHALRNEANPLFSALLFAPGPEPGDTGVLYAYELLGRRFDGTRLVVLSGCETATGPGSSSEAALGLSISFLAAGVPAVIGSLWRADDRASQVLFQLFYRHLSAGSAPASALRSAILEVRASPEPALHSPAAWASFELIGGEGDG
jgi:CHAT domain-containing protein/tetratricopeptide (TPR) repeat protein